jgi:serine-type D-Ala-D-Ala carboxypeptidase (penicillin-binding protein 5/6)
MISCQRDLLRREVASITKMMTFYSALKLCQKYSIDPEKTFLTVSRGAAKITGTSADLREGDTLSIQQLFYGMMLPSGNDAAFLLAEYFGSILRTKKYFSCDINKKSVHSSQDTSISTAKVHQPNSAFVNHPTLKYFLKEMNDNAIRLKLVDTQYDSPHGLMNRNNFSSAYDICLLANECM